MKSQLELYIETTLKTTNPISLRKIYLLKAIALIDSKLNSPCCDGNPAINLYTSENNFFTSTITQLLNSVEKKGNIKSLTKAKKLINFRLGNPCCI